MKRKKSFIFNKKPLTIAQFLLLGATLLVLALLVSVQGQENLELAELMQKNLTFNIFYFLCMFDAICVFELSYFKKKLLANEEFETMLLNILLVAIVQFCLLDIFVALLLFYFIYQTLRQNGLTIKKLYFQTKLKGYLKLTVANSIFFILSAGMIYTMIIRNFM